MPDIVVTEIDLASGIKAKNLVVPPMPVQVLLRNPPADLQKAIKADKLIVQKIAATAFEKLKAARDDFRAAIADLDAGYTRKPPADKAEAEARVQTLNATCRMIAKAQGDAASAAAMQEWTRQAKKNKDLTVFKVVFGLKMALGTISVAASVVSAVMSLGTLAVTIVGGAKTVLSMAMSVETYCRGIATTEKDIIDTDATLAKAWQDKKLTGGKIGRELAAALGLPLVKSIGGLGGLLDEYNAKSAKKDAAADAMWKEAKKLMAAIRKAPDKVSPAQRKTLDALGDQVTSLLDQIGALVAASEANDAFYSLYLARMRTYQAMEGKPLGRAGRATGVLVAAAGVASTAGTVVQIAQALV